MQRKLFPVLCCLGFSTLTSCGGSSSAGDTGPVPDADASPDATPSPDADFEPDADSADAAPPSDADPESDAATPIRVAYVITREADGSPSCASCIAAFEAAVTAEPDMAATALTWDDIKDGQLTTADYDVFHFPGGGSLSHHQSQYGATGEANMRAFVASGGGYLGICIGAFAGAHFSYGMGLANVQVVSTHTGYGSRDGDAAIAMNEGAIQVFSSAMYLPPTTRFVRHANGPLLEVFDDTQPLYRVATFIGEEVTLDAPPLPYLGHPCIVYDFYFHGRVILAASHAELNDGEVGNLGMIAEMIRWLAGRGP